MNVCVGLPLRNYYNVYSSSFIIVYGMSYVYTGKSSHKRVPERAPPIVEIVRICTVSTPRMFIWGQIRLQNKALPPAAAYWVWQYIVHVRCKE